MSQQTEKRTITFNKSPFFNEVDTKQSSMVLELRIVSEFENVSSSGKRKTGVNGEKPLG